MSRSFVPLRHTRRYKIVSNYLNDNQIYVERIVFKFLFFVFTTWVSENDVYFGYETKEEIFDCDQNRGMS